MNESDLLHHAAANITSSISANESGMLSLEYLNSLDRYSVQFWAIFSLLYSLELGRVLLGPFVSSALKLIQKQIIAPIWKYFKESLPTGASVLGRMEHKRDIKARGGKATLSELENDVVDTIPIPRTAKEDQKAYKGSSRDVENLRQHGYDKYRYVSKAFLKRNGLKKASTTAS